HLIKAGIGHLVVLLPDGAWVTSLPGALHFGLRLIAEPQFLSQPAITEAVPQKASSQPDLSLPDSSPQASPLSVPPKSPSASLEKRDGKINIGPDIWINEAVWTRINCATKDSIFIKELAVAISGTGNLKGKSVSGKECPTKHGEPKPPLTPAKLGILKECFWRRMDVLNVEPAEKEWRAKQVGHFLTEKIMDINGKGKKKRQFCLFVRLIQFFI
uniref:BEN domain-containing protein n=1 Tax=Sparus aurata TaxID=8175 RepID=A0A671WIJ0_SPAAU